MQTPNMSRLLYPLLAVLMINALTEMSFIAATVSFLHTRAGRAFEVSYNSSSFSLHGKPLDDLADQGHVSNGAAGTALILVGIGGFLTFPSLRRDSKTGTPTVYSQVMAVLWLIVAFLSILLDLAALVFTFVVTARHAGQEIDESIAAGLNNRPYPNDAPYPLQSWTPENWFAAVLQLELVSDNDRALTMTKWRVMRGWRWNLNPMFILGLAVLIMGILEYRRRGLTLVNARWSQSNQKTKDTEHMNENVDINTYANGHDSHIDSPVFYSVPRKPLATQQKVIPA